MPDTPRNRRRGLTLIEMMVVILIIAIIGGVLLVAVTGAFGKGKQADAEATIRILSAAVANFETNNRYYPPSSFRALNIALGTAGQGIDDPNGTNKGIETLAYILRSKNTLSGKILGDDDFDRLRGNTDGEGGAEMLAANPLGMEGNLLAWELLDPWGNPYVYINLQDEQTGAGLDPLMDVMTKDGQTVTVDIALLKEALRDLETGLLRARTFLIWSFGENGINDYGKGDDVVSWQKLYDADDPEEENTGEDGTGSNGAPAEQGKAG